MDTTTFEIGTRRLVRNTGGSFFLSVPISWVRHHHLEKGARISVSLDQTTDQLILTPPEATQ